MSDKSGIEWCDATWNFVTGCTQIPARKGGVSGCTFCYAKVLIDTRQSRNPTSPRFGHRFEQVLVHEDRFAQPLHWQRPRRIFVNSLSDVFHEDIPDETIDLAVGIMAVAKKHVFQLLTKRPARMRRYLRGLTATRMSMALSRATELGGPLASEAHLLHPFNEPPYRHIHVGVSVSSNDDAWRVEMLDALAAIGWTTWASAEPLLRSIDRVPIERLKWVVVGGESETPAQMRDRHKRTARPMHPVWAREVRDRCVAAGVPLLVKQWGNWAPRGRLRDGDPLPVDNDRTLIFNVNGTTRRGQADGSLTNHLCEMSDGSHDEVMEYVDKHDAGRELDGRTWDQYPV